MYSVVLVDDEKKIIDGLTNSIPWNELGVEKPDAFTDPLLCMNALSQADILVTDVQMPGMSGLELIERAKQINPTIKVIVMSVYDDFNFVRSALKQGAEDYLLKPINRESLLLLLESTIEQIKKERVQNSLYQDSMDLFTHNLLNRWVTASVSVTELYQRAEVIGLKLYDAEYVSVVIRFLNTSTPEDRLNHALRILGVCKTILSDKCVMNYYCFHNDSLDVVIVFSGEDIIKNSGEIKYLVNCCIKEINASLKMSVYACIGKAVKNYVDLHESYETAMEAFHYCMFLQPNKILLYENMESLAEDFSVHSLINIETINSYLENRDISGYSQYIDTVFKEMEKNKSITAVEVQWVFLSFLFCISSYFMVNPYTFTFHNNIPVDIYKYKNLAELKQGLISLYEKLLRSADMDDTKFHFSPVVKRALQYIDANYTTDISLGLLAEELHINPSYFGQLFKAETGQLFTNYINVLRIKKAVRLIKTTNLKLSEISMQVGYNNTTYFYKIFKKIMGKSPSEYKLELM